MDQEKVFCLVKHEKSENGRDFYQMGNVQLESAANKDKPVVVISIAGKCREGKSFLMSLILRYLKCKEKWLEDTDTPLRGFPWKMSCESETSGINIWSELFPITLPTGEEMFTDYGKLCLQCQEKPFQKLLLLVRDWKYPHEYQYGIEGGKKYLDRHIQTSGEEKNSSIQEFLQSCFLETSCYLMPHPGTIVTTDRNFDGSQLSDMENDFTTQLKDLVQRLISPENVITKKIADQTVTLETFMEYCRIFVTTCNEQDNNLFPEHGIVQVHLEVRYGKAVEEAYNWYRDELNQPKHETISKKKLKLYREEAINKFREKKISPETDIKYKEYLHHLEKAWYEELTWASHILVLKRAVPGIIKPKGTGGIVFE
ncbi:unnamed protein product [Darwinula stevensoni]|uniref:GB1/RHD3-type G domain-containing protein n=1 Tax=Darwinula stevensoni TaxID=69355 RepID=A0A7R9FS21_9CRUS|nr:unnamed protein product [Darwinula stevensoni]CAG0902606.1 unnamed protein product [Darwinula stevensoni]